ncbi:hypothetical protein Glove_149g40 [Diversispora epigaea]|uniref:Uncharacterized protein n=1 Tax=Diversispora epigaea TaxID=1348612 RepID=A0A397J347_9GLOM|nr:hypothetical protein Glove_149g40 [Diversispora epigaea]
MVPNCGHPFSSNQMQRNPEETFWGNRSYTPEEFEILQATLDKQLGPEFLSTRPGPSVIRKLLYVEAWKVINIANNVFGFNGWSSSIEDITVDYVDCEAGRYSVGVSAITKIILKDGTYHTDTGYGSADNMKIKALAFEKAKKEAVTDAIKRTLRMFGNVLGNCLYDKSYAQHIIKLKVPPKKFEPDNLLREPEFSTVSNKRQSASNISKPNISQPSQSNQLFQNIHQNNNVVTENNEKGVSFQVQEKTNLNMKNVNNVNSVKDLNTADNVERLNSVDNSKTKDPLISSISSSNNDLQNNTISNIDRSSQTKEYTKEEIAAMFEEFDRQNNHYLSDFLNIDLDIGSDIEDNQQSESNKEIGHILQNEKIYFQNSITPNQGLHRSKDLFQDLKDSNMKQKKINNNILNQGCSYQNQLNYERSQLKNLKDSMNNNISLNQEVHQNLNPNHHLNQCIGIKRANVSPTNSYLNNQNGHHEQYHPPKKSKS